MPTSQYLFADRREVHSPALFLCESRNHFLQGEQRLVNERSFDPSVRLASGFLATCKVDEG